MDPITRAVAKYISDKGISILNLTEKSGLSYKAVYPSLCSNPTRCLRAEEFMKVCSFLDVPAENFWNECQAS